MQYQGKIRDMLRWTDPTEFNMLMFHIFQIHYGEDNDPVAKTIKMPVEHNTDYDKVTLAADHGYNGMPLMAENESEFLERKKQLRQFIDKHKNRGGKYDKDLNVSKCLKGNDIRNEDWREMKTEMAELFALLDQIAVLSGHTDDDKELQAKMMAAASASKKGSEVSIAKAKVSKTPVLSMESETSVTNF